MWNYTFVFPSLMVLVVFVVYYFTKPRLPIRMNRTFLWVLGTEVLTIVFDVVGSEACVYHERLPQWAVVAPNLVFFVLFLLRIYLFYLYTADVLMLREQKVGWIAVAARVPFYTAEMVTLSSIWTGAVFFVDGEGYHRGPLYPILYVCFGVYLVLSLAILFLFRAKLTRFELFSGLGYNLVLTAGYVLRILVPNMLVMGMFSLVAIVIIYLSFENPDLFLSDRGNTFNMRAFRVLLAEWIDRKRPYRLLGVVLRNYNDQRGVYGGRQMDSGVTLISQYLQGAFQEQKVFYLRSGCFLLMGDSAADLTRIRRQITDRFRHSWMTEEGELFLDAGFVQLDSETEERDVDRVVSTLTLAFEEAGSGVLAEDSLIDVDKLQEIDRQVDVKRALERAIEQGSVEVFLQPLVESRTRKVVSAEALARIRDEEGTLLSPAMFIPIAEHNGQINRLGEQVLDKTCRFIAERDLKQLGLSWINVNLSPIQCMRRNLSQELAEILRRHEVGADQIHLEITEESMIDLSMLQRQIQALQAEGFQFALDDYGSGYSNLVNVKRYFFVNIKLDMELVRDYFAHRDALLPAVVQAFKAMNYTVTAEGIESEEMADAMAEIGCDYLQGFYFSRPLPMEEFAVKYGAGKE